MHTASSSYYLRAFALSLGARSGQAQVLAFLAPAVARTARPPQPQRQRPRTRPQRRNVSSLASNASTLDKAGLPPPQKTTNSSYTHSVAAPQDRNDADAWAALLEPYLPLKLRSRSLIEKLSEFDRLRCIDTLPQLLFRARTTIPLRLDLLSYLGVNQGRWEAVIWLTKTLLAHMKKIVTLPQCESILHLQSWRASGSLEELTLNAVWADPVSRPFGAPIPSLDKLTNSMEHEMPTIKSRPLSDALGHIWQSTGSMILEATDRPPEECRVIMSHVYQILAHLHHIGAIPNKIYNYSPAKDPSVLQRPPTLHLLSSRILTTLSDAVWRAQEKEVISEAASVGAEYSYKGHELPEARYKLRVRELGTEVWLELILWSCVEGGWISEAAWIVTEMEKRKGKSKWSVINWDAIQEPPASSTPKASRVDWQGVMSRLGGAVGGIEGYNEAPPFVEMGPRTISSEVVAALVDGLVNLVRPVAENAGKTPAMVWENISTCKKLLERGRFGLESNSWNSIILRLVESQGFNPETEPGMLERVLHLAPTYQQEFEASNSPAAPGSFAQEYVAEQSAASLGLLHRTLHAFACQGDLQGALRTVKQLQSLIDANRYKSIKEFKVQIEERLRNGAEDSLDYVEDYDKDANVPGFHPHVPVGTLAVFLDLVTDARLFEVGEWLLYSDAVDGRIIPTYLYNAPTLQPALLRFATATKDVKLFNRLVTREMTPPLPEGHLRAILHCQIALGKWDSAEELLKYRRDDRNITWDSTDVMAVASSIVRLEKSGELDAESAITRARTILRDMLQGDYNTQSDPSQGRDFSRSRLLNQLCRVFRTVPGLFDDFSSTASVETGQAHTTIAVSVHSFNILLDGVAEACGSVEGRRLWTLWCRTPKTAKERNAGGANHFRKVALNSQEWLSRGGPELVVAPNLQTLRTIMRPAVEAREEARQRQAEGSESKGRTHARKSAAVKGQVSDVPFDEGLFAWAGKTYRDFGLTNDEITQELRGSFPTLLVSGRQVDRHVEDDVD
ncbi:MAG: hypothetical protein FRX48_00525 [Lasallia pustulata]|uniref:Uncharacterized protein n=1 Tax=Lasallia pustulata TaxID=136370 RepID=A0A5M8Q361_9LECA|nr:MAG: hypothetical protein FRX48_00525 [Lasallia pustulata]